MSAGIGKDRTTQSHVYRTVDAAWLEEVRCAGDAVAAARVVFEAANAAADTAVDDARVAQTHLRTAGKVYQNILDSADPGILDINTDVVL